jgi:YesN/AraC family two-component response regulator
MPKVLVIEDSARARDLFLRCLKTEGYHALGAENGAEGVSLARRELPDLVICDILMPEVDGYNVLLQLQQNSSTALIPFIFLTAKACRDEVRKGMELGADDYLTKPCQVDELLRAIAARLEKQKIARQWCLTEHQALQKQQPDHLAGLPDPQAIFPSSLHLQGVFKFIEENYSQPITLTDVAKAVDYSPAYLTNLVKRQTQQTVHCWIVERRMAEARKLLLKSDAAIKQIATQVGYPDPGHFTRQFRQCHKVSPKDWRQLYQKPVANQSESGEAVRRFPEKVIPANRRGEAFGQ